MAQLTMLIALIFISAASQVTSLGNTLDCECGKEDLNVVSRIFGGRNAAKTKLPWIASVLVPANDEGGYNLCTGSLINDRYILTAAACFTKTDVEASKLYVSIKTQTKYDYTRNTLKVASYLIHPDYKEFVGNNVALIKLENRIDFNRTATDGKQEVSPICLASFDEYPMGTLSTAGFGYVDNKYTQAEQLMEVDVTELESMECIKSYRENNDGDLFDVRKFICAQSEEKGINVGDFGAPLAVREGSTVYQAGVASHYFIRNTRPYGKLFDVYERVNHLVPWIKSNTEDANWCRAPLQAIQPKASCEAEKKELEQTRNNYENEKIAREKAEREQRERKEQEEKEKAEREAREEAERKENERKEKEAAEEQRKKEAAEAAEKERQEKEARNPPPPNQQRAFTPIKSDDADSTENKQTGSGSSDQSSTADQTSGQKSDTDKTSDQKSSSEQTSSEGQASGTEQQATPNAPESQTKKEPGYTCGSDKTKSTLSGTWQTVEDGTLPSSAFVATQESNKNVYVCRVTMDDNLIQGKLVEGDTFCTIVVDGKKSEKTKYEVLMKNDSFSWQQEENGTIPNNSVIGGHEGGCHSMICNAEDTVGNVWLGRLVTSKNGCQVLIGDSEETKSPYKVLYRKA